jgi:hypothetical protein
MKFLAELTKPPKASKDFDETETLLLLPFFIYFFLAVRLRELLRRRLGQRAGTIVGNCIIVVIGGPPCLLGCATLLLIRISLNLLDILDKVTKRRRPAGHAAAAATLASKLPLANHVQ